MFWLFYILVVHELLNHDWLWFRGFTPLRKKDNFEAPSIGLKVQENYKFFTVGTYSYIYRIEQSYDSFPFS